jgi:hypothetical protein
MNKPAALVILVTVGACAPISPERAAEICEDRSRAAQGPTGGVTLGANSRTSGFASVEIGVSSNLIAGRDPLEVYETCVFDRTGAAPVRPPVLR